MYVCMYVPTNQPTPRLTGKIDAGSATQNRYRHCCDIGGGVGKMHVGKMHIDTARICYIHLYINLRKVQTIQLIQIYMNPYDSM